MESTIIFETPSPTLKVQIVNPKINKLSSLMLMHKCILRNLTFAAMWKLNGSGTLTPNCCTGCFCTRLAVLENLIYLFISDSVHYKSFFIIGSSAFHNCDGYTVNSLKAASATEIKCMLPTAVIRNVYCYAWKYTPKIYIYI